MKLLEKLEEKIGVKDNATGSILNSTRNLRRLIGFLGMLLPVLLVSLANCTEKPIASISHYFYTRSGPIFVAIMCLVGVFLIIYKKNFWWSCVAGIAAIAVAMFPTGKLCATCNIVDIPINGARENLHYIAAVVFLVILNVMVFFVFPKPDNEETAMQKITVKYQPVYQIMGIAMLIALLVMGFRFVAKIFSDELQWYIDFYDPLKLTFWMEFLALEAFGVAWLVRGITTFKQKEYVEYVKLQYQKQQPKQQQPKQQTKTTNK